MTDWIQCPGCGLKHSHRPNQCCPRCKVPTGDLPVAPAVPESALPPLSPESLASPEPLPPPQFLGQPPQPEPLPPPQFLGQPLQPQPPQLILGQPLPQQPSPSVPAPPLPSPLPAQFTAPVVTDQGNGLKQYFVGLGFGTLGAGVSAAVMVLTGYEVGALAWGIGMLVGIGAKFGAGADGTQIESVLLATISALVLAKVLAITLGSGIISEQLAPDLVENKYALSETLVHQWAIEDKVPRWMALPIQPDAPGYDQVAYDKTYYIAFDQLDALAQPELEALALTAARQALEAIPIWTRFSYVIGLWDFLWGFLAFSTAYKVSRSED